MSDLQHLLAIDDLGDDFRAILEWAIRFKQDPDRDYDFKPLDELSIGCIYEKPSTRTRVSFEVGVHKLGGQALTLLKGDIQMGKSERGRFYPASWMESHIAASAMKWLKNCQAIHPCQSSMHYHQNITPAKLQRI